MDDQQSQQHRARRGGVGDIGRQVAKAVRSGIGENQRLG